MLRCAPAQMQWPRRPPRRAARRWCRCRPRLTMNGGASSTWSPLHAVDGAAHRVDHQAARHGLLLDAGVELELGVEGAPCSRGPPPARWPGTGRARARRRHGGGCRSARSRRRVRCCALPRARWRADRRGGSRCCTASAPRRPADGRGRCGRAGRGRSPAERLEDLRSDQHGADRREAAAQPLGDRHQVRARCPPARRRAACRCGPCRTSPRRGSAGCRAGRRSRARA